MRAMTQADAACLLSCVQRLEEPFRDMAKTISDAMRFSNSPVTHFETLGQAWQAFALHVFNNLRMQLTNVFGGQVVADPALLQRTQYHINATAVTFRESEQPLPNPGLGWIPSDVTMAMVMDAIPRLNRPGTNSRKRKHS